MMDRHILFNHIPKTGGTTLRIILNRVYGEKNVFFIESKNIGGSLEKFGNLNQQERASYKVIAGHGANLFLKWLNHPFCITVLREPISLFISQYAYLKVSSNSIYLEEVKSLDSIEDYLDYAKHNGHDNLQTRLLSGKEQALTDLTLEHHSMDNRGDELLNIACDNISTYDAVLDLKHFESGVYVLGKKLNWKHVPVYRPLNVNRKKRKKTKPSGDFLNKLQHALRFDISLYNYFKDENLDISRQVSKFDYAYRVFQMRQAAIARVSKFAGR